MSTFDLSRREATHALWAALKELAPSILIQLRQAPNGDAAVTEWAIGHGLNSPWTIDDARGLREFWAKNPHAAAVLRCDWTMTVIFGKIRQYSQDERDWVDVNKQGDDEIPWSLPEPSKESLNAWLERAERMYRERERIIYG